MYITDIELDTHYHYLAQPTDREMIVVKAVGTSTKAPNFEDSTVSVEITIEGQRDRFTVKPHQLLPIVKAPTPRTPMIDPLNTMLGQYAADKALPDAPTPTAGDYSTMTTEDFDRLLVQHLVEMIELDTPYGFVRRILAMGDIGVILSKEWGSDVFEMWEQEQADEEEDENPYEHDSSYNGCTVECAACDWEVDNL